MDVDLDLAFRDDLTGAFNRRFLTDVFERHWRELVQHHGRVALIMIDLDGFKEVNDTLGHGAGDAVLKATVELLRAHFRDSDTVIRFGGDEFVVLLPGVDHEEARAIAERARALGERDPAVAGRKRRAISFSIGVAIAPEDGETGEAVLEAADRRLYAEKRERGRSEASLKAASRRSLHAAFALLAVAVVLLVVWTFTLWREARALAVVPEPAPSATPEVAVATLEAEELALREEILDLQNKVQTLTEALAAERSRDRKGEYEGRISELDTSMRSLASRLEGRARASSPTPLPQALPSTPTPAPPATPLVAAFATPEIPHRLLTTPTPTPIPSPPPIVVPPRLASAAKAAYPPVARSLRKEATVVLRVTVGPNGRVTKAVPLGKEVGFGFEAAARAAAMRAIYEPAHRGDTPIEMESILTVKFEIEG